MYGPFEMPSALSARRKAIEDATPRPPHNFDYYVFDPVIIAIPADRLCNFLAHDGCAHLKHAAGECNMCGCEAAS